MLKPIISGVAILILTLSVIGIISAAITYGLGISDRDRIASLKFLQIFLVYAAVSAIITYCFRKIVVETVIQAILIVLISWLVLPILSAIAYSYSIGMSFIDALFESMSGLTGTGLTVIQKPELMPLIIRVWRGVTQWVGELGIVVFSGSLLPFLHRIIRGIYMVERGQRVAPTIIATVRRLLIIYSLYTVIGIALFALFGMPIGDAIIHSMTAIATGGMSTSSKSIGLWITSQGRIVNWGLYIASIIIMILGAFNFVDHDLMFKGRFRELLRSTEFRWFFIFLGFFSFLALTPLIVSKSGDAAIVFYHLVSGYTTTGFQLADIAKIQDYEKYVLILAMIVGGATFSTAGGIKIKRAAIIVKTVIWEAGRLFIPPARIVPRRIGREQLSDHDILSVFSFTALYMVTLAIVTAIIMTQGYSFVDSLFEASSALSCVGLSVGIASANASPIVKAILIAAMYLGRLEFTPLYLLIGLVYRRRVAM